jgi:hypothetical protein
MIKVSVREQIIDGPDRLRLSMALWAREIVTFTVKTRQIWNVQVLPESITMTNGGAEILAKIISLAPIDEEPKRWERTSKAKITYGEDGLNILEMID